jgi:crotonobetainyl-CoA:carnitine CoA-transferase CaiB-like acyl-CoA transferase
MTSILDGLRVIDLSTTVAGAVATMLLADHGAEVVKVEGPDGDPVRHEAGAVVWLRGKQSVVLDLDAADDRSRLLDLVASADVVVDTFTPATRARLGLDDAALRRGDPRLVTCSITAYGDASAASERFAHEALVQARSGLQYEQPGLRDGPIFLHAPLVSVGTALLAVAGVSAALYALAAHGEGRHVDTSMLQGALAWTTQIWNRADDETPPLHTMWRYKDLGPTPCFEAADGKWFHPMTNGLPIALAHVGRDPGELDFKVVLGSDRETRARFFEGARELFLQRPRAEWVELLQRNEINCQPIQPVEPVFEHPQLLHTGGVVTIEVPGTGAVTQLGHTYDLEHHRNQSPGPPPAIGEHTATATATATETAATPRRAHAERGRPTGATAPPLAGIRVLDLGTVIAGPYGGMILADLGADVIRIEPMSPAVGTPGDSTWASSNRGKRSLAVDLKSEPGRAILHRLLETADVVHYNLRTGVAERLGFGWEQVHAINPRTVHSHLTAYGSSGPLARWPGSDQTAQALCGLEHEQGATPAGGHPTWLRFGLTDAASGLLSVIGILQALAERERTGVGQRVETDILRAGMLLASDAFLGPDSLPRRGHLDREQTGLGPWCRLYETGDGWLCVVAPSDDERAAMRRVLGVDTSGDDHEVAAAFAAAFRTAPAAEWQARLDLAGVGCELAQERTDTWPDQPDAVANGWIAEFDHPVWGRMQQPGPFLAASTDPGLHAGPPVIGEHTAEVVLELGWSDADVTRWREQGVIGV